jgi:hypothetical protein
VLTPVTSTIVFSMARSLVLIIRMNDVRRRSLALAHGLKMNRQVVNLHSKLHSKLDKELCRGQPIPVVPAVMTATFPCRFLVWDIGSFPHSPLLLRESSEEPRIGESCSA